jgi:hypothetical protein
MLAAKLHALEETDECGWTLFDAFYLSVATMSTVGFGDLLPSTGGMKDFTIFFIVVAIVGVFRKTELLVSYLTSPASKFGRRVRP